MKRSEMILKISKKLQKQMHLINSEVQRNNPKMLCDNLASRVMNVIEDMDLEPPEYYDEQFGFWIKDWEDENEA